MEIEADFVTDLSAYFQSRLDNLSGGIKKQNATPADISKAFFNAALRRIPAAKRTSHSPNPAFDVPEDLIDGYRLVLKTSEEGGDLLPFQSTSLLSHDGLDAMLFDWGIYHLHLGIGPHPKLADFNKRTGPLLYVMVTDTELYQIAIKEHGEWHCIELLDIVERNWPHLIARGKAKMEVRYAASTEEEVKKLRAAKVNMAVRLASGNVYTFMANGLVMSGDALTTTRAMITAHATLQRLEKAIKSKPDTLVRALAAEGHAAPERAILKLVVDPDSVKIVEKNTGALLHTFTHADEVTIFGGPLSSRARHL